MWIVEIFSNWWMDKQNVVYPYKGILFYNNIVNNIIKYCKKKEWSAVTCIAWI